MSPVSYTHLDVYKRQYVGREVFARARQAFGIFAVDRDAVFRDIAQVGDAADVVAVSVGKDDPVQPYIVAADKVLHLFRGTARIDHESVAGIIPYQITIRP